MGFHPGTKVKKDLKSKAQASQPGLFILQITLVRGYFNGSIGS